MNKQQLILLAKRKIAQRRQNAQYVCDKTLATLRSHDDWRSCEHALKTAMVDVALYNKEGAKVTVKKYKEMQTQLLAKYNFTTADLVPHYHCTKCEDTGYVNGEMCSCLQNELRKLIVAESNVQNENYTFENSTETDKHNNSVYKAANTACESGKNIVLLGKNGTGKTYLISACVNKCAQLGKSVLFTTAYNLNSLFLECHLSDLATNKTIMDNLIDVDVLAIDDLGTETVYKNVTAEYMFALVNERISRGKQTFITTNLQLADMRERYDERIFSRLMDKNTTLVAQLVGNDKRIQK